MSHEGNDKIIDDMRDERTGNYLRTPAVRMLQEEHIQLHEDNACAVEDCDCMKDFPNCDPYVNFDHSDCTSEECRFTEGAY